MTARPPLSAFPFLALLLTLSSLAPARASAEPLGIASSEFGLLGAVAIPVSDFGGTDFGDGHAKLGIGGGLDFLAHLTVPYLSWSTGLFYLWNSTELSEEEAPSSVSPGSWLNVPFLTGLRAQTANLGDAVTLYGQIQAGVNFASMTDTENQSVREEVGWTTSLGFSLGAGVLVQQRIHLGVRFFNLGEPEYTARVNRTGASSIEFTQEPRLIAFMVGVYFDATN